MFDSLLLLSYGSNFCIHNYKNQVIIPPDKFKEQDHRNAINYFILKGAFNNVDRFEFDTVNIKEEDFIPALIFFNEHYLEQKFNGLKGMLGGFINSYVDDCYIEGCFRYLNAYMDYSVDAYQVDIDCGKNFDTNFDNPFYRIKGFGNGIIEYLDMVLQASGHHVYFDLSFYSYCKINGNNIDTLNFRDFFMPSNDALKTINLYVQDLMKQDEGETLRKIEPANLLIDENSTFFLSNNGITFLLLYNNEERFPLDTEDEYELMIPYSVLEKYIPEGGLIRQIQEYNPPER